MSAVRQVKAIKMRIPLRETCEKLSWRITSPAPMRAKKPPLEKVRRSASRIIADARIHFREPRPFIGMARAIERGRVMPQKKDAMCGSGKKALDRNALFPPTFATMLEYSAMVFAEASPRKSGRKYCYQMAIDGSSPIMNGRTD